MAFRTRPSYRRRHRHRDPLRRGLRLAFASGLGAGALLVLAAPAAADLDEPCVAEGTLVEEGETHQATESSVTVPRSDTVEWRAGIGSLDAPEGDEREVSGSVRLKTPFPLVGEITLDDWGPSASTRYSNAGSYEYSLPAVAGGATLTLTGDHRENGALVCSGEITIEVDGGGLGNPATWGGIFVMAVSGAGLVLALRA